MKYSKSEIMLEYKKNNFRRKLKKKKDSYLKKKIGHVPIKNQGICI